MAVFKLNLVVKALFIGGATVSSYESSFLETLMLEASKLCDPDHLIGKNKSSARLD